MLRIISLLVVLTVSGCGPEKPQPVTLRLVNAPFEDLESFVQLQVEDGGTNAFMAIFTEPDGSFDCGTVVAVGCTQQYANLLTFSIRLVLSDVRHSAVFHELGHVQGCLSGDCDPDHVNIALWEANARQRATWLQQHGLVP